MKNFKKGNPLRRDARPFDRIEAALSHLDDASGGGGGALAAGGAVNIWRWRNAGYLMQYYAVGLLYGGLPATVYPFFLGYLSVPSFIYSTVLQVIQLPWAFKLLFGMVNDCFPLWGGYRRKPYMVIGWAMACVTLLALSAKPLPLPFWCVNATSGEYITKVSASAAGAGAAVATPCNPASKDAGGAFALWMCLAACGYVVADVAADGLTVEYARREPAARRGTTQATVYFARACGQITAALFVGLCMNGKKYNGTFDWSLGFSAVMFALALPCAVMVPVSWWLVQEQRVEARLRASGGIGSAMRGGSRWEGSARLVDSILVPRSHEAGASGDGDTRKGGSGSDGDSNGGGAGGGDGGHEPIAVPMARAPMTFARYRRVCWSLLQSRAIFYSVMYQFLSAAIGTVSTTASGNVQKYWAGVHTLQLTLFSIVGLGIFAAGLRLVQQRYLGASWRRMLLFSTLSLVTVDAAFTFCTVFGVVRNQYFYLGELVIAPVIEAVQFLFAGFVIVEMADDGNEGMVYGLMTTMRNCGLPFARAIGNQIFGAFTPSLSAAGNYIADTPSFRRAVAGSCALAYCFQLAALALLPLMPDQKSMAQRWKHSWPSRPAYGRATLAVVVVGWLYACIVDLLAMFPSTACLAIAGGGGCTSANVTMPL
eukprot:g2439.t1